MTTSTERLEEVERQAREIAQTVGPTRYAQACDEVDDCIPPWAKKGMVSMDAEAIRVLMIAAWLRGYGAQREGLV